MNAMNRILSLVTLTMIVSHLGVTGPKADDLKTFERLILDAQENNKSKFSGGTMKYKFTMTQMKRAPIVMMATTRWNKDQAFWSYQMSDPAALLGSPLYQKPVEQAPVEYLLKLNNLVYSYKATANVLMLREIKSRERVFASYYMFDVFPDTLGSKCCVPAHLTGRNWSELVGSNYAAMLPSAKITMERISSDVIRQTRKDDSGAIGTIDFSLSHAGLPVRMEFTDSNNPAQNGFNEFTWRKVADSFLLQQCKVIRGGTKDSEANAREVYEFIAESISLSNNPISMDFIALKSLLPKNTTFDDRVRNKVSKLDGKSDKGISDKALDNLSDEVKSKGFIKP